MKTLIHRARIVSPDVEIENGALLLEEGRISAVLMPGDAHPEADLVIDAEGRIAMPGFFDIHCHGANGYDVCDNTLEAIRQIAQIKLKVTCNAETGS